MRFLAASVALAFVVASVAATASEFPAPKQGEWIAKDFRFHTGEVIPELRLSYTTVGEPTGEPVVVLHGTTGSAAGVIAPGFGGELFGEGQVLDAKKYFIVIPDAIGHGNSSKPSNGLRTKFPEYNYDDMVQAQYRLLKEGLGIRHLRLLIGNSMGGMHVWLWGSKYPDYMDALVPMAAQPSDQKAAPTRAAADKLVDARLAAPVTADANDFIYQWNSSRDYNASPGLEKIQAALLAINSADDERNPPETGIMERELRRVKHGRLYLIPASDETRGHIATGFPKFWVKQVQEFLATAPKRGM